MAPDLRGLNSERYQRQMSGGIQELMEALCFQHYLATGRLLSLPEAAAAPALPPGIELAPADYLLGVFDFVGEVMRFAITVVALGGGTAAEHGGDAARILRDLRALRAAFEALDTGAAMGVLGKEVAKKMAVMQTCVQKVENAVYGVIVRGSEMPPGWVPEYNEDRPPREEED